MLKTRFPFLYASTILDAKTFVCKTLASNRNFESCMSILCLALQHILQFFHFCRGFFLCLWQLCSSINAPLNDRDKKKTCVQWVSFPEKSWCIVSPVVLLVCGSRRRDNLLAWGKLFANPYELKSHTRVWEKYNHFERIYRVCRLNRFLKNFAKRS